MAWKERFSQRLPMNILNNNFCILKVKQIIIITALFVFLKIPFGCTSSNLESISVRNAHAMAYNTKAAKVYLFGGANEKKVLSDLWILKGNNWKKVKTNNTPGPRTFTSLIYDKKNDRLLLFGGNKVLFGKESKAQNLLNDTWEFKNGDWKKIQTKNRPSQRAEAAMVYDPITHKTVLFGGYTIKNGDYIKLGDTWEFYNNDWHFVTDDGPSPRHGVAATFHEKERAIVLFGGSTIDKQYGASKGETWLWKKRKWVKSDNSQALGVFNAVMVYDKRLEEIIRFGGWDGEKRIDQTWIFKNHSWKQHITTISPSARNHSALIYDDKHKRIILFGGHDGSMIFGDTWEFSDYKWKKINVTPPRKRIPNHH